MFAVPGWNLSGEAKQHTSKRKRTKDKEQAAKSNNKKAKTENAKSQKGVTTQTKAEFSPESGPKTQEQAAELPKDANIEIEKLVEDGPSPGTKETKSARKKRLRRAQAAQQAGITTEAGQKQQLKEEVEEPSNRGMTPMQRKMQEKLSGGKFRWLNEHLYTKTSHDSKKSFNKDMLAEYHEGFRRQVQTWPENPVDVFLERLKQMVGKKKKGQSALNVADLGCGDASLAREMQKMDPNRTNVHVHSYDLEQVNELVEACDIASVPLPSDSVDVAIFCLSLMGTNFPDFLKEANRLLKQGGKLWIAEIKSRFTDHEAQEFTQALTELGFRLESKHTDNKMFISFFAIKKSSDVPQETEHLERLLKPCIYKRR